MDYCLHFRHLQLLSVKVALSGVILVGAGMVTRLQRTSRTWVYSTHACDQCVHTKETRLTAQRPVER